MAKHKLAVLGCGNMGSAIALGLAKKSKNFEIIAYNPTPKKAQKIANETKGKRAASMDDVKHGEYFLIACKPQQFGDLAKELLPQLSKKSVIVSIMAGVSVAKMKKLLPKAELFVRVMPNTPCLIGEGVSGIYFTSNISKEKKNVVKEIFSAVSKVFFFKNETEIDTVTAATGAGPAYIFEFAIQMIQKTIAMGIDPKTAEAMIQQLFVGASLLMANSPDSPETLRNKVTSKGGTTEAALKKLKEYQIDKAISEALEAAFQRAKELSQL